MNVLPTEIKRYLERLETQERADGYLCLNDENQIVASEGWVGDTDLAHLDPNIDLVQTLPILEGLLPANKKSSTVISNAHIKQDVYFDIHVFYADYTVCILFIDKTRSAKILQQEQQIRLNDDFDSEKEASR